MSFLTTLRKHWVATGVVIVVIVVAWLVFGRGKHTDIQTMVVHPGPFVQQVSVSGTVQAAQDVDLGFAGAGRIAGVYVKVGDSVAAGRVLAELENDDLKASLASEQARYAALVAGTRPEDVAITEAAVADDRTALINALASAYAAADGAVRSDVDQFVSNPRGPSPQLSFSTSDSKIKSAVELGRVATEQSLAAWQASLATLTTASDLEAAAGKATATLAGVTTLLTDAQAAIARGIATGGITQTMLDAYAADIASARASVSLAIADIASANASLTSDEKNLALKQAGSTSADLAAQAAQVAAAEAALKKTLIVAPFGGIITNVNAKVGAASNAGQGALSMIGSTLQIESYVPEVNVALIGVGNPASTTLDAYGDAVFPARVASIDPAETVRNGVSTYRTILAFTTRDARIRSGMTANVVITTAQKDNVIAVPQGIVTTHDSISHVRVMETGAVTERVVTTGEVSSTGSIEITSGLVDGDVVLSP